MIHEKKKSASAPFLNPEYSRLNRQVIIETAEPPPEGITSDDILRVVNWTTSPQGLQFLPAFVSSNGRIQLETGPTTSADAGVALRQEI